MEEEKPSKNNHNGDDDTNESSYKSKTQVRDTHLSRASLTLYWLVRVTRVTRASPTPPHAAPPAP